MPAYQVTEMRATSFVHAVSYELAASGIGNGVFGIVEQRQFDTQLGQKGGGIVTQLLEDDR